MQKEYVYVNSVYYDGEDVDGVWCAQIQIIGRRSDGRSVCVRVSNVYPYFFCNRESSGSDGDDAERLKLLLRSQVDGIAHKHGVVASGAPAWRKRSAARRSERTRSIEINVSCVTWTSIYYYQGPRKMFRIEMSHPQIVAPLRDVIISGTAGDLVGMPAQTYESNVEFVLRFMVDTGVCCHGWIQVSNAEQVDDNSNCTSPDLICRSARQIHALSDEEVAALDLKVRNHLMSFDIECASPRGVFPDPTQHPVIQIACDFTWLDGRSTEEIEATATATILCLRHTDASIVGSDVTTRCFDREQDLLYAFADLVRKKDPDVITSWNGPNFDWRYIVDRCATLKLDLSATSFARLRNTVMRNRDSKQATKAHGHTDDNQAEAIGRVIFDMMEPVKKNFKIRSYGLGFVSKHFLGGETKDDVDHTQITELFEGTPADRGKLGHYCVQDARLPRRLLLKTMLLMQYLAMARVCGVPTSYLTNRGQQIKTFSLLLRFARADGFVIPFFPVRDHQDAGQAVAMQAVTYEGATVIEPVRGFHVLPVATLDYASLYPSIMREADINPSYDTYLPLGLPSTMPSTAEVPRDSNGRELTDDDVYKSSTGDVFVKASVRPGILSKLLGTFLDARRRAKKKVAEAKAAGNHHLAMVFNCEQLALKGSANSTYGFTGVTVGKLPLRPIARTVTARGRELIELTIDVVTRHYRETFAPIYGGEAEVIYGDTDSVMIKFKYDGQAGPDGRVLDATKAIEMAFFFGLACAKVVTDMLPWPHDLEMEKVYYPYLLINKKRYAGGLFPYFPGMTVSDVPQEISTSGLETVRRDNAKMIPRQLQDPLDALMKDFSPDRAVRYAQESVEAIVRGPVPAAQIANACATSARDALSNKMRHDLGYAWYETIVGVSIFDAEFKKVVCANYLTETNVPESPHESEKTWLAAIGDILADLARDSALPSGVNTDVLVQAVQEAVTRTLRTHITFDDHTISQKYGRPFELYTDVQPHIEMMKRMARRTNDTYAGQYKKYLGDRVDFIIAAPSARYTDERVAYRAEDPTWSRCNGVEPDPVYYIQQLLRPLGRILKPLVGSKSKAYQLVMKTVVRSPNPSRGFVKARFDSKTCCQIWGTYASGKRRNEKSPARLELEQAKKADKIYKAAVLAAELHGDPPPVAPKRPRKAGPMDMFVKVHTPGAEAQWPRVPKPRAEPSASPAELEVRARREHAKAISDAVRLASIEGTTDINLPTRELATGPLDTFVAPETPETPDPVVAPETPDPEKFWET